MCLKRYIALASLLFTFFLNGQTTVFSPATKLEIINAYENGCMWFINTKSYSFKVRYTSFRDHSSFEKVESSEGYYKRVENKVVSVALGIRSIQDSKLKILVDTSDKTITILNSGTLKPTLADKREIEDLLTAAKSLKKSKITRGTIYRIEFDKNELYEAYEFTVSNSGFVEGITFYYSEQSGKDYDTNADIVLKPRLEITFFAFNVPAKYTELDFSHKNIEIEAKGDIKLTGQYSDYRLMDYRLRANK